MRSNEMQARRADATDRAFTDIKSMISQFRQERVQSKERLNRGRSGGRLSSREASPSQDAYMTVNVGSVR